MVQSERRQTARPKLVFLSATSFFQIPDATVQGWANEVASAVPELSVAVSLDSDSTVLADATALFGTPTSQIVSAAPRLDWVQAPGTTPPPGFVIPELASRGAAVTRMCAAYADNLADHAMAMLLGLARGLPAFAAQQRAGVWNREPDEMRPISLAGRRLLLIGVGRVGRRIAERARPFGLTVVGIDLAPSPELLDESYEPDALDDQVRRADIVVANVPDTAQTSGMFDATRLRLMKPDAILINIGRGSAVRLQDLASVLGDRRLRGVGLDVFEHEPLPPDDALWRVPRAVLTPHVGGAGDRFDDDRLAFLIENARRYASGEPLLELMSTEPGEVVQAGAGK